MLLQDNVFGEQGGLMLSLHSHLVHSSYSFLNHWSQIGSFRPECQLVHMATALMACSRCPCLTGLHPLTPYFSQLIAEEGRKSLKSLPTLHLLLKVCLPVHPVISWLSPFKSSKCVLRGPQASQTLSENGLRVVASRQL